MQYQAVNIAYVIIHRTVKFMSAIHEWNHMPIVQNMWVVLRIFFSAYQKIWDTADLTMRDAVMHHTNMVRGVVEGVKEVLKLEQALIETPVIVLEPHEHV